MYYMLYTHINTRIYIYTHINKYTHIYTYTSKIYRYIKTINI